MEYETKRLINTCSVCKELVVGTCLCEGSMSKARKILNLVEAKVSDKEEKSFTEYVYSFYSPKKKDALYPVKSQKTLDKAIEVYLKVQRGVSWGKGDTADREAVIAIYDIIER